MTKSPLETAVGGDAHNEKKENFVKEIESARSSILDEMKTFAVSRSDKYKTLFCSIRYMDLERLVEKDNYCAGEDRNETLDFFPAERSYNV